MRISIDSSEPLEDVIRVVGALYGVTLTVTTPEASEQTTPKTSGGRSRGRRAGGSKTTPKKPNRNRRAGNRRQRVSNRNAEVRSWARQNGYTVSDRGRIPAAVVEAYHQRN